jgi:AraC-type DNA-binding domain-containing proteins
MQYELEKIEHMREAPMKSMIISVENSAPHWHFDYEILFVLKGSLMLQVGKESYVMNVGDIVLINSCEIHSVMAPQRGNLCIVVQFHPKLLEDEYTDKKKFNFLLNTILDQPINRTYIEEFRRILANIGLSVKSKPDGYQFLIKSYLYKLLSNLFCYTKYSMDPNIYTDSDDNFLVLFNRINDYLKANFKNEIRIDDLCHFVGMSRSSVYRVLKTAISATYKDLIGYYRIDYSKEQLKNTKYSISYIASSCGFESDVSFYRLFRKIVGISPSAYRNSEMQTKYAPDIQGYVQYDINEAVDLLKKYL